MNKARDLALLQNKDYTAPSVFLPENLLREARRQKNIPEGNIPAICVLDPDGDIADYLIDAEQAQKHEYWACYHSSLYSFYLEGVEIGIVPCIVGSSYAVLISEQLFVSGCELLISVTSAGVIDEPREPKQYALITEAIRDEGTSYHYLPPDTLSRIPISLYHSLSPADNTSWFHAKSWTTDAPYRETETAINAMKAEDVTCVEMEASALYALAQAKDKNVICFAHLTNTMAQQEGDFEKGENFGSLATLNLIREVLSIPDFNKFRQ